MGVADELTFMGSLKHLKSLQQRDDMLQAVLEFHCEGRIQACIEQ